MTMKNPRDRQFHSKADRYSYDHRNDGRAGKGDKIPGFSPGNHYRDEHARIFKRKVKHAEG